MKPSSIVSAIGSIKIEAIVDELNSGQFKRVLLSGNVSTRIPMSVISLKARSRIWKDRLLEALGTSNEAIASHLFYEWLLNRRRAMLSDYLDLLGVKHRRGETDETFLKTLPEDILRNKAKELEEKHAPQDVGIYVHYLDYHQKSEVFEKEGHFMEVLKANF
jgi:hypothetical protein